MNTRSDAVVRILSALTLILALGACKKEKKDEKGGEGAGESAEGGDKSAADMVAEATGDGASAVTGDTKALAYLPKESEVVISFSLASARSSALWDKYKSQIAEAMSEDIAEMQAACGIDPLVTLQSMTLGVHSVEDSKSMAVIEGFKRSDFEKCAEAAAKKEGKAFKAEVDGKLVHYTVGDEDMWASWVGGSTLLLAPESDNKDWVAQRASGKDGLDTNKEFMALVAKADKSSTIWFAGVPTDDSPVGQGMGAVGSKPSGFYGSLKIKEGLSVNVGVSFANPDEAAKAEKTAREYLGMAKSQLPMAAAYVDKLKLSLDKADVRANLELTAQDLEQLGAMLGGFLGGMAGGM